MISATQAGVSAPDENVLTINPKLAHYGILDGFMGLMFQTALHLQWHGDDPFTQFTQEKGTPIIAI